MPPKDKYMKTVDSGTSVPKLEVTGKKIALVPAICSSSVSHIKVREDTYGERGIYTERALKANQKIYSIEETIVTSASPITVFWNNNALLVIPEIHGWSERSAGEVKIVTDGVVADNFINHSCDPNCKYVVTNDGMVYLVATRNISPNEELTVNYNTFELDNDTPFDCACGHETCTGKPVAGFRNLSTNEQRVIFDDCSPPIQEWFMEMIRPGTRAGAGKGRVHTASGAGAALNPEEGSATPILTTFLMYRLNTFPHPSPLGDGFELHGKHLSPNRGRGKTPKYCMRPISSS